MAVTLDEIARHTGVSKATVSRVLNDDPRISSATRVRVRAAMSELGYRGTGRSAQQRTGNLAFLIADPIGSVHEDLFFNEVLRGVTEQLEPGGYHVLISPSDGQLKDNRLPGVVSRIDGVIAGGVALTPALVQALLDGPVPVVLIGRYGRGKGMSAVLPDNEEGARLATEHLLGLGRQRIAFIGGPADTNILRDRLAGFRQTLVDAGHTLDPSRECITERTAQGGIEGTLALLEHTTAQGSPTDAIFAADDWIAMGVLRALRQRGIHVPDDVAVVGYSDIALAAIADPPLTTVHVPKRRLGRTAAKLLLDLISGEAEGPVQIIVSPSLVVREST